MKSIYIILLLFFLFGCVEDSQLQIEPFPSKVKLVDKGLLRLSIDSQTSFVPSVHGYSHSMNLFYLWNNFNQSLYFFDLEQNQQVHKVPIPLRTELGINEVSVVNPYSLDSIFIFDHTTLKLHIFNALTQEISSFKTLEGEGHPFPIDMRSLLHVDTKQGNVFIRTFSAPEFTKKENSTSILRYNFIDQESQLLIPFPDDYISDYRKQSNGISFDFDQNGDVVYSLPFENEFLVIDISSQKVLKRVPKNSPFMRPYKPIPENLSIVESKFQNQTHCRWYHISYDPYRNLSLHVGIIGQVMPDHLPDDLFISVPRRKSVNGDSIYNTMMIFDANHDFLGEVQPSPGIVHPLVTPQGILQLKYDRAPEESQDELMFYVYDIEHID